MLPESLAAKRMFTGIHLDTTVVATSQLEEEHQHGYGKDLC